METWVIGVIALVLVWLALFLFWHPRSATLKWSILIVLAGGGLAWIAPLVT